MDAVAGSSGCHARACSLVIETVMIFALGFLAASLCGLLLLPAVNARAARLARRRAEARLPLSPAEIAAEQDFLRAQFAVQQRRLERRVETVEAKRQADMAAHRGRDDARPPPSPATSRPARPRSPRRKPRPGSLRPNSPSPARMARRASPRCRPSKRRMPT